MSYGVLKAMKRVNKVRQSEVKLNELIYCDCILVRMFVVESGMGSIQNELLQFFW